MQNQANQTQAYSAMSALRHARRKWRSALSGVGRTALRCRASPLTSNKLKLTYHESNAGARSRDQVVQQFKFTAITVRKPIDFVASHAHSRHCLYHLVGISIHGLIFRSRFPDYCRSSVLAVCRAAGHSYQGIKWHSATWGTVRGPRAPRAFVWYSNSYADLFQGPSPPHYKDTDRIEC